MLVPCVLELYLELRRFMSIGKCWNTKYRGTSMVIVPYIHHNAVHTAQCRMPYKICRTGVRILSNTIYCRFDTTIRFEGSVQSLNTSIRGWMRRVIVYTLQYLTQRDHFYTTVNPNPNNDTMKKKLTNKHIYIILQTCCIHNFLINHNNPAVATMHKAVLFRVTFVFTLYPLVHFLKQRHGKLILKQRSRCLFLNGVILRTRSYHAYITLR